MCHKNRWLVVSLFAGLMLPEVAPAQAVLTFPLPVFGYGASPSPYGLYGSSFYAPGIPYGLGYRAAFFGYGANAVAANLALYNPLRYNAAFTPAPYDPTPQTYNPLLYNAAFNPALAAANAPAYAAAGKGKAVAPAADKAVRPAADTPAEPARIHMTLPTTEAIVTLQGVTMTQTGTRRLFITPPLEAGSKYSYDVVVRWRDGGQERSLTRCVSVRAGQELDLSFPNESR